MAQRSCSRGPHPGFEKTSESTLNLGRFISIIRLLPLAMRFLRDEKSARSRAPRRASECSDSADLTLFEGDGNIFVAIDEWLAPRSVESRMQIHAGA